MTLTDFFALLGVIATVATGLLGALVAWRLATRRDTTILQYSLSLSPLLPPSTKGFESLRVEYQGDELPYPMFLVVDVTNLGRHSINDVPILVRAPGTTYVYPGYVEDMPLGYSDKWEIARTGPEECTIHLEHLNPGQVVKARFLLDEQPKAEPLVACAMPDIELRRAEPSGRRLPESWLDRLVGLVLGKSISHS